MYHLRVDPDCRLVLDWTAGAFERLTGYSAAEIEALGGWTVLVEREDLHILRHRARKLLAGGQASAEYQIKSRDRAHHWLRDTGRPEWDEARELVVGVLCVAQDTTERRGLEEQLLARQLDRRSLISLTDGLVCEFDGEGRLLTVAGHTDGDLAGRLRTSVGRRLEEVIGPGHAATWQRQIERIMPDWAPVLPFALSHPAGHDEEHYEVRLCAAAGGVVLALIQLRSRLSADGDPARSDAEPDPRLRSLLELQRSAAVLLAPGLKLNDQVEQLTGWERANAIGRPFVELMGLVREQPALQQDLERARSGVRVSASEASLRLPDGREGRLLWNYVPLIGPDGQLHGVLA
ncbi:MAG TPA: PAS domain-containing protein [Geminicoccaceae bacterium]|nr:PAS domain-containing protein [Geminicoccaceae bacterium]